MAPARKHGPLRWSSVLLLICLDLLTYANGQDNCDKVAAEACLNTLHYSNEPCTDGSLDALQECFETHLSDCPIAMTTDLRHNRTVSVARCRNTCAAYKMPFNPCGAFGSCSRVDNTWEYMCSCEAGWTGQHCEQNIDECSEGSHNCGDHGMCQDKLGSYICLCDDGYIWQETSSECERYDKCKHNIPECSQICTSSADLSVATCSCRPGYMLSPDNHSCVEDTTDLCSSEMRQLCQQGCQKVGDGEECFCYYGYNISSDDPSECTPNNRCEQGENSPCPGMCVSNHVYFTCLCPAGSKPQADKETCIECDDSHYGENCVEECNCGSNFMRCGPDGCDGCKPGFTGTNCLRSLDTACSDDVDCGDNGNCQNQDGVHKCVCNAGYVNQDANPTAPCIESDECENDFDNDCAGTCVNTDTGYSCTCPTGFELGDDNLSCNEIDYCSGDHGCDHCIGGVGTYTCFCEEGYELNPDGKTCDDINECSNSPCEHTCMNNDGSFICECNDDYTLNDDGISCDHIDDCISNDCEQQCVDDILSYTCTCNSGYILNTDGKNCDDINECETDTHGCQHSCENTPEGSYTCICNDTHVLNDDMKTCDEINPCDPGHNDCTQLCTPGEGLAFTCSCNTGYNLLADGKSCNDIDECAFESDDCEQICDNNDGGYTCRCNADYVLNADGETCREKTACEKGTAGCEQHCTDEDDGTSTCSCDDGFMLDTDGKNCNDIDECTDDHGCAHNCNNMVGSYECSCNPGYTLKDNKKECKDINECDTDVDDCEGTCINTDGTFICKCGPDHVLNADGKSCDAIDYCAEADNPCGHMCQNIAGGYECTCPADHRLNDDGTTCDAIDYCAEADPPCAHTCTNKPGGKKCSCNTGYILNNNKRTCRDINECSTNKGGCQHKCKNTPGSFTCSCHNGFVLLSNGKSCGKICLDGKPCPVGATCDSTGDARTCDCGEGQFYKRSTNTCHGECTSDLVCPEEATCQHEDGADTCDCGDRYNYNENTTECKDKDECADDDHNDCTTNAKCINNNGGYACECNSGWELKANNIDCKDIDECSNQSFCIGSTQCINRPGSYLCPCDSTVTDNSTLIFRILVNGNDTETADILEEVKKLFQENEVVVEVVEEELTLYDCNDAYKNEQMATRRLLEMDESITFVMVAGEGLTSEDRALLALALSNVLNVTNITIGSEQVLISLPQVIITGLPVTITDRCSYLSHVDFCKDNEICHDEPNNKTECIPVPTKAQSTSGLDNKTVTVIGTSAALGGLILLSLIALGGFICYKQKKVNDYYKEFKSHPNPAENAALHSTSTGTQKTLPIRHGTGIRINYGYNDPEAGTRRSAISPALHSGTARKWSGTTGQGWQPSVGKPEEPLELQQNSYSSHSKNNDYSALNNDDDDVLDGVDTGFFQST